jgi:NADH:ubiquinone oxidoreductase subunit 2 (subunit N)
VFVLSISHGYLGISIFAILMAIVGVYYYFYVVREVFTDSDHLEPIVITKLNAALIIVCSLAVIVFGVFAWNLPI